MLTSPEIKQYVNNKTYQYLIKPVCFASDPEKVHNFFIRMGKFLGNHQLSKKTVSFLFNYQNRRLEQTIEGIFFPNPVGLSAGFDKNAEIISIMEDVGFGFVEAGSITALSCAGNTGKRVARIPNKKSLWINFGLNNRGVDEIAAYLRNQNYSIPFGISIAKTNCKETVDVAVGIADYIATLKKINGLGAYYVLNISCPNSFGGQPFADPVSYEMLLKRVSKLSISKPIFVKISPDLSLKNVDAIIQLSLKYGIRGFICTNLTKKHSFGTGGLSGKSIEEKSNALIEHVYRRTKGKAVIIGVGGIFSAQDAYEKIKRGANLVELITGMIYNGPSLIGEINYGLSKLLQRDGYDTISQAVGSSVKL